MPASLCKAFRHAREFPVPDNEYPDGASQRSKLGNTSRKFWEISKRLNPTLLAELRDFYDARKGAHEPFYFYDPWETSPLFGHDPTGATVQGRYIVRFDGGWGQETEFRRSDMTIRLVELA